MTTGGISPARDREWEEWGRTFFSHEFFPPRESAFIQVYISIASVETCADCVLRVAFYCDEVAVYIYSGHAEWDAEALFFFFFFNLVYGLSFLFLREIFGNRLYWYIPQYNRLLTSDVMMTAILRYKYSREEEFPGISGNDNISIFYKKTDARNKVKFHTW